MTVYVDDMYRYPMGRYYRMKMSHMIADTEDELFAMADKIGVARKWFQRAASSDHFDISMDKRKLAIEYGAKPITLKQLAMMCRNRRKNGVLGEPDPYYAD